jgi:hypothetical protein
MVKNMLRTAVYHAWSCSEPLALHHISEVIKVELSDEESILGVTQRLEAMLANEPGSFVEDQEGTRASPLDGVAIVESHRLSQRGVPSLESPFVPSFILTFPMLSF